jgi:hypothetical protein
MPGFQLEFSKEQLSGVEPISGLYTVQFVGFKPKYAKEKNPGDDKSINLNLEAKIVGHPETELQGKPRSIFVTLNNKGGFVIQDVVHSFGIPMDNQLGTKSQLPGFWDKDKAAYKQDNPETWKYYGPLDGKRAEWELCVGDYNGRPTQRVRRFLCKVKDCATLYPHINHAKDLAKNG